jgi:sugar phosphate isomerase/epimerase
MDITFSIFPKFCRHLSAEQLAEFVKEVGLDTTNMAIRDGYWVSMARLACEAPAFVKTMAEAGLKVRFATAGFTPEQVAAATPWDANPVKILADAGITEFRMNYFRIENGDVRWSLADARRRMESMVDVCLKTGVRAIYQVHHGTLLPSAYAGYALVDGLDPKAIGIELDPGNQAFEGYERPELAIGLTGEYLRAFGVKDVYWVREAGKEGQPGKGWKRDWTTLDEGIINWYEIVRQLRKIQWCGTFVWMPFYETSDFEAHKAKLKREVAYMRKVVADVEAEAAGPAGMNA